jgi:hypothetical protein
MWLVPDELVHQGAADRLLDQLGARADSVRVDAPQGRRTVTTTFGQRARLDVPEAPAWARSTLGLLDFDDLVSCA